MKLLVCKKYYLPVKNYFFQISDIHCFKNGGSININLVQKKKSENTYIYNLNKWGLCGVGTEISSRSKSDINFCVYGLNYQKYKIWARSGHYYYYTK